jgi:hypothetical protein
LHDEQQSKLYLSSNFLRAIKKYYIDAGVKYSPQRRNVKSVYYGTWGKPKTAKLWRFKRILCDNIKIDPKNSVVYL